MKFMRIVAAACVLGLAAGCAGGGNAGADTICKAFNRMSDRQKDATVVQLLKEDDTSDPATSFLVQAKRTEIGAKCLAADNKRTKIGDLV